MEHSIPWELLTTLLNYSLYAEKKLLSDEGQSTITACASNCCQSQLYGVSDPMEQFQRFLLSLSCQNLETGEMEKLKFILSMAMLRELKVQTSNCLGDRFNRARPVFAELIMFFSSPNLVTILWKCPFHSGEG